MKGHEEGRGWVFLYGGQGAQKAGMGRDFDQAYPDRSYFRPPYLSEEEAAWILDPESSRIHESYYAQLGLTAFALTVTEALKEKGLAPQAALGLSAGEFPALAAARVYSPSDIMKIVRARAGLMSKRMADRRRMGFEEGMLALVGLDEGSLKEEMEDLDRLCLANINAKAQLSVSGPLQDLEVLRRRCLDRGVKKAVFLDVEGAFHSPVFDPDVAGFKALMEGYPAAPASAVLPLNLLGRPAKEPEDLEGLRVFYADIMSRQMASATRLDDSFTYLLDQGYQKFLEIAPRPVLAPLLKRRSEGLRICQIGDLESYHRFVEEENLS